MQKEGSYGGDDYLKKRFPSCLKIEERRSGS
jgi:hypothetical protein